MTDATEPSREQRAETAIADIEHAMKHNAPVAIATLKELRDLLGVAEKVIEEVAGDPNVKTTE